MRGLVVLNYNDSKRVVELVNKCFDNNVFDEIVVVDNCSKPEQLKELYQSVNKNIKVIENKVNKGYAKGYNDGLKYLAQNSNLDQIFLINSDIIFTKELVDECSNRLKDADFGAVSTYFKEINGDKGTACWDFPKFSRYLKWMLYLFRRKLKMNLYTEKDEDFSCVDVIRGSFIAFNKKALVDVNYFDEETFLYFEENCIFSKMKNKGYKVGVIKNFEYIHNHPVVKKKGGQSKILKFNHQSAYHYFTVYQKINIFQKIIFKLLYCYSMFEMNIIDFIKKY